MIRLLEENVDTLRTGFYEKANDAFREIISANPTVSNGVLTFPKFGGSAWSVDLSDDFYTKEQIDQAFSGFTSGASEMVAGIAKIATDAEAIALENGFKFITPATLGVSMQQFFEDRGFVVSDDNDTTDTDLLVSTGLYRIANGTTILNGPVGVSADALLLTMANANTEHDALGTQEWFDNASGRTFRRQYIAATETWGGWSDITAAIGTANRVPKYSATGKGFVDSSISEVGGNVGIRTATPSQPLDVVGNTRISTGWLQVAGTDGFARYFGKSAVTDNPITALMMGNGVSGFQTLEIGGGTLQGEPATALRFWAGTAGVLGRGVQVGTWYTTGLFLGTNISTNGQFISTALQGTAPFIVGSTTIVQNLNVPIFADQGPAYYLSAANLTGQFNIARHPLSGIAAGTYSRATYNESGHAVAGFNPTTLAGYGITDALRSDLTYDNPAWITGIPWSKVTGRPGTERYLPRFGVAGDLVNSVIYQDASGNIGFGTSLPQSAFDFRGVPRFYSGDGSYLSLSSGVSPGSFMDFNATNKLTFRHNGATSVVTMTSDKRMGINQPNPQVTMDIGGDGRFRNEVASTGDWGVNQLATRLSIGAAGSFDKGTLLFDNYYPFFQLRIANALQGYTSESPAIITTDANGSGVAPFNSYGKLLIMGLAQDTDNGTVEVVTGATRQNRFRFTFGGDFVAPRFLGSSVHSGMAEQSGLRLAGVDAGGSILPSVLATDLVRKNVNTNIPAQYTFTTLPPLSTVANDPDAPFQLATVGWVKTYVASGDTDPEPDPTPSWVNAITEAQISFWENSVNKFATYTNPAWIVGLDIAKLGNAANVQAIEQVFSFTEGIPFKSGGAWGGLPLNSFLTQAAGNAIYQTKFPALSSFGAMLDNGFVVKIGDATFARSLTGPGRVSVTNGSGSGGNVVIDLKADKTPATIGPITLDAQGQISQIDWVWDKVKPADFPDTVGNDSRQPIFGLIGSVTAAFGVPLNYNLDMGSHLTSHHSPSDIALYLVHNKPSWMVIEGQGPVLNLTGTPNVAGRSNIMFIMEDQFRNERTVQVLVDVSGGVGSGANIEMRLHNMADNTSIPIQSGGSYPFYPQWNISFRTTGTHNKVSYTLQGGGQPLFNPAPEDAAPGGANTEDSTHWVFGPDGNAQSSGRAVGLYSIAASALVGSTVVGTKQIEFTLAEGSGAAYVGGLGTKSVLFGGDKYSMINDANAYLEVQPDGKVKLYAPTTKSSVSGGNVCELFVCIDHNRCQSGVQTVLMTTGMTLPRYKQTTISCHYHRASSANSYDKITGQNQATGDPNDPTNAAQMEYCIISIFPN